MTIDGPMLWVLIFQLNVVKDVLLVSVHLFVIVTAVYQLYSVVVLIVPDLYSVTVLIVLERYSEICVLY